MAIKGKSRTRTHARRTVALPPRPQLVVRKPPIWRRRWLWAIVGAAILAGAIAGIIVWLAGRSEQARLDREVRAVQSYATRLRGEFPDGVELLPPHAYRPFPTVSDDLNELRDGKAPEEKAVQQARQMQRQARSSADGIEAIPIESLIPAEFAADRAALQDSQYLVVRGLRLFETVAALTRTVASLEGSERKALADEALLLADRGDDLFARGLGKLWNMGNRLGLQTVPTIGGSPSG